MNHQPASQDQVVLQTPVGGGDPAFLENYRLMMGIVHEMKEIPQLPSEVVKDNSSLHRVEFPAEGGILTYMSSMDHPYKGFPHNEMVDKIDYMKKISRAMLSGMYHRFKGKGWLSLLVSVCVALPSLFIIKDLVHSGIYTFYRLISRFRIKPIRYSQPIRELHRAFSVERNDNRDLRLMVRDIVCMIFEFDNAYRFRFQDIAPLVNKKRLKRRPIAELKRLFSLMQEREKQQLKQ